MSTTVAELLAELPEERRAVMQAVRDTVVQHLPAGYEEVVRAKMINYEIPLSTFPKTYNKQPLPYAALAAQKHHYALYLFCVYQNSAQETWLREQFAAAGKKLDMGRSCLRFKKLDDLPLNVLGELIASTTPDQHIAQYQAARGE